jgi:hypothetical protein
MSSSSSPFFPVFCPSLIISFPPSPFTLFWYFSSLLYLVICLFLCFYPLLSHSIVFHSPLPALPVLSYSVRYFSLVLIRTLSFVVLPLCFLLHSIVSLSLLLCIFLPFFPPSLAPPFCCSLQFNLYIPLSPSLPPSPHQCSVPNGYLLGASAL